MTNVMLITRNKTKTKKEKILLREQDVRKNVLSTKIKENLDFSN